MRLSDIDLRLLRVFKAVAESGGFVKAQGILGINQPAISSHIANLERRLNVRLCNRGPGGFSLTQQGEEVLRETKNLLEYLDDCANNLNKIGTAQKQLVRIGVVDCAVADINNPLHTAIRKAKSKLKDIRPRIGVYDFLDCMSELRAQHLDIAMVGLDEVDLISDDVLSVHLYDETSGLFCAKGHPCAKIADEGELFERLKSTPISAHSFLVNPINEKINMILMNEKVNISQGNVESSAYLALAGTHVALMPIHYANQWVKRGDLVALASEQYQVTSRFHAIRLSTHPTNQAVDLLWSILKSLV